MAGSRARNEWAGTGRITRSAPAVRLLSPGRRHDAQATAVREEAGQPVGDRTCGGASFGSLRLTKAYLQELERRHPASSSPFDVTSEVDAWIPLTGKGAG